MATKVCLVYPYAGYGGVERVILNRGLAFRAYAPDVHTDLVFLSDVGGLTPMKRAIEDLGLGAQLSVTATLAGGYDFVSLVDCPQAIPLCDEQGAAYVVECHSPYRENRRYLGSLRPSCRRVVTPSPWFSRVIREEIPDFLQESISELRNFVPWDLAGTVAIEESWLPEWRGRPVLFLARLDSLKDPVALLDAAHALHYKRPGDFMFLFCGPRTDTLDFDQQIRERGLESCTAVLPPVPFHATSPLLQSVALRRGLFVSPSRGESFGLSAAEAICESVPVLLSDIEPHRKLVEGFEELFTYPTGDSFALARGIERLTEDYDSAVATLPALKSRLSAEAFMGDWQRLLDVL